MGRPDLHTTADTPLYGVFDHDKTGQKTYLVFNADKSPKTIQFSDGQAMTAPPGKLVRMVREKNQGTGAALVK
jgi:hypothetical protein